MAEIKIIPARDRSEDIIRTAAYARVSSDSEDQINSYNAQIRYYTEMLSSSINTVFVDMYADEGITGTSADKREDFLRLMKDCRRGRIDRVLTKSVSRFARNTKECLEAVRELKTLGISVYFEKENIDTGELSSEMLLTLHSQFAQEESISISKNCRMGVHKRMADGTYITPSAPYGYHLKDGRLLIDKKRAEVIRQIYAKFLDGMGTVAIANELNKIHAPLPVKAKQWYSTTVMYILRNERYIGDSLYQKKYTTDTLPFTMKYNNGEKPQYYVADTHEPIVSKEQFEAAKQIIEQRKLPPDAKKRKVYPFSKKIICGLCGTTYKRKIVGDRIYWVCRVHNQKSADLCKAKPIPETQFQLAFIRMFNKLATHYNDIITPAYRQMQRLSDIGELANTQVAEIRKEIAEQKAQCHLLSQLNAQGVLDSVYFTSRSQELNRNLVQLHKQLHAMLNSDEDEERLAKIKKLISILESSEQITEFDEEKFSSIVEGIIVLSEKEIRFELIGGIAFNEPIQRKGR